MASEVYSTTALPSEMNYGLPPSLPSAKILKFVYNHSMLNRLPEETLFNSIYHVVE
jgi:hypothetical protein